MSKQNHDGATVNPRDALAQHTAQRFQAISDYKGVLDQRGNSLMEINEKSGPRSKIYRRLH